jgi:hypothetical protein
VPLCSPQIPHEVHILGLNLGMSNEKSVTSHFRSSMATPPCMEPTRAYNYSQLRAVHAITSYFYTQQPSIHLHVYLYILQLHQMSEHKGKKMNKKVAHGQNILETSMISFTLKISHRVSEQRIFSLHRSFQSHFGNTTQNGKTQITAILRIEGKTHHTRKIQISGQNHGEKKCIINL